jgi:ankyrin repeat protein
LFKTVAIGLLSLGVPAFSTAAATQETLVDLVRAGNREAVLAAITSPDIDVNAPEPDGSTALSWATYKVDHELVRALLKAGAKANITNAYGSSPLTEAVKLGDVELVRMLLEAGSHPDSPNADNQTALMLASSIGSLKIAELLTGKGANVNAVERFRGQTALMWAAGENHPDVVDLLIARGANVKLRAKHDDWPRQMTSEPRAQFRPTGGLTALLYATRSGCYRCAVAIVKAGADVNQPNPDGITPLINALDNRSYDIAMFLLDKGANPSAWDMYGRTPLYVAVDMNSYSGRSGFGSGNFQGFGPPPGPPRPPNTAKAMDIVNRLLSMGIDPNHQLTRMRPNGNGRGRFADYMMRGGTGPLMIAALSYDDEAIKTLLAHGAEVDLPNVFQITPLMAAANMSGSSRGGVGSAIGGGGQRVDVQDRVIKTISLLLDAGASINARVIDSHTRTAKLVAYVQGRDNEGQTALFGAAESGWDRVVKHLLDRGADPAARDAAGKTALDYARSPRPAGPGARREEGPAAASRAATVALLEAVLSAPGSTSGSKPEAGGRAAPTN